MGDDLSVRKATLRSTSSNLAEQTPESLSVEQAAKLLHPLDASGFMTTPDADLSVDDEPTSPHD